jgi:hypothetical protein
VKGQPSSNARRGRARYQALLAAVERALNEADPVGLLAAGAPADEYTLEIGSIVPRVAKAQSVEAVTTVLHEELLRWFGGDNAGPRHGYDAPAAMIWEAVLEFRKGG